MKIQQVDQNTVFRAVAIEFTFESQEELDVLGKLLNHAGILRCICNEVSSIDRNLFHPIFKHAGADVRIGDFHDRLKDAIV